MLVQETIGLEASRTTPCPLCDHDHYCYLVQDGQGTIIKAICQWTDEAPEGWNRTGTAKDGRGIFTKQGLRTKRRHFPDYVQLSPQEKADIPQWKDHLLDMSGDPLPLPKSGKERELAIEYLYPNEVGQPLGKVVRRQWSDRRRAYDQNRKTKHIRPWHWVGTLGDGFWSDRGKGDKPWPLYRETEAKEEILRGGVVFAVAGEQAVETYRSLGLTAVTCQGGEANCQQIVDRLASTFDQARADGHKPILAIHPDNDITGESKFGELLLRECEFAKIPAVALNPFSLWAEMPPGGDIKDWVDSGITNEAILQTLEIAIDEAIEFQEEEARARVQRSRWKAPEAWHGELGYWVEKEGNRVFIPKTDFDFQVERELASEDGGGLVLQIKRTVDRSQRRIFIKSTDYTTTQKFEDALKRALGDNVICNLSTYEVKALIRVRLHEYHITRKGKVYRLIDRVGQQANGTWVFKDCQFTQSGEPTVENDSLWVWNSKLTGEESTCPAPAIAPQDPNALKNLVDVMRRAFGSNIYPALINLGYAAAAVHYQQIIEEEGAFPILNSFGDPASGKTTAAQCALSLVGMHNDGMLSDISLSAAYERLKLAGSLLHCFDDPMRTPELNAFLKGFYNGKARVVRGKDVSFNVQRPHSPMMVTSNHACGENDAATQSRLVRLWFRKTNDGDRQAFYQLPAVQKAASGCLTQLIKLGYPAAEVHQLEQELLTHLPLAHIRIAKSLALVLCYAMKVAQLAEASEDLKGYILNVVCPGVNDPDEAGDSLRDFFEKLFVLHSQSKIGDWNLRYINGEDEEPKALALHIPSVWAVFDKEFSATYNRKVIESLIAENGGHASTQKFHRSEDESKAYYRTLLTPRYDANGDLVPPTPPQWTNRRCLEIPIEAVKNLSEKNMLTMLTGGSETAETTSEQESRWLTSACEPDVNHVNQTQAEGEAAPSSQFTSLCEPDPPVHIQFTSSCEPTQNQSQQALEPPSGPPVHMVHIKNDQTCEPTTDPREVTLEVGDKVRIDGGRFAGKIATVLGCTPEEVTVKADTWAISRPYQRGDLYLLKRASDPDFNEGDRVEITLELYGKPVTLEGEIVKAHPVWDIPGTVSVQYSHQDIKNGRVQLPISKVRRVESCQ